MLIGKFRNTLQRGRHSVAFWHDVVETAIENCREGEVEIVLLAARDLDLQTLGFISELSSLAKVILVCERSGKRDIRKALDAGALGLVPASEIESVLLPVIDVVRVGQVSVPGVAGLEAGQRVLTSREKQILGQVVLGMSNAEIAAKLFLAESTVKSHLSSAFAKLGVTSRNEAAALILNPTTGAGLGILTIPTDKSPTVGLR